MSNNKIQTSLRLEEVIWKKFTYIAKKNKRSFNNQIEYLIEKAIEDFESANGTIPVENK